jgi:diguanylate cyclase (GGDEF)-like protein
LAVILVVGLSNLVLGYLMAVLMGYGPPHLLPFGYAVGPGVSATAAPAATAPVAESAGAPDPTAAPAETAGEPAAPAPAADDDTLLGDLILKLHVAVTKGIGRIIEIEAQLRESATKPDGATVKGGLDELLVDCQNYLTEQRKAADEFHGQVSPANERTILAEQVEITRLEQAAQVESLIGSLQHLELSDPADATQWLISSIGRLSADWHKLRDAFAAAFLNVARRKGNLEQIAESLKTDPLTSLPNRIGLEVKLEEWRRAGRAAKKSICAGLLDLDQFGALNLQHGGLMADRILYHVAQYVSGAAGQGNLVARIAGQRLAVLTTSSDAVATAQAIQGIRQSIEQITFSHGSTKIRLTASGAVTALAGEESSDDLWKRLGETLGQAKQSGGNRVFLHEGAIRPAPPARKNVEPRDILV